MTRRKQRIARVAAAELASAIRSGDSTGIERSQRELGRLERAGRRRQQARG